MRHLLHGGHIALFVASILAWAFSAAPSTAAEIFKCVAKDGIALYQNFPCNIDSIGSVASSSPPTKGDSPPPAGASTTKSNTALMKGTSAAQSGIDGPRVGMTVDEVRTLWGEPDEMVSDEPAEGGRVSNWRYADGRTVQFDHKHRVLSAQR